jgi:hypothetical protein
MKILENVNIQDLGKTIIYVKCISCKVLYNIDINVSRNNYKVVKKEINTLGKPKYLKRSHRLTQ